MRLCSPETTGNLATERLYNMAACYIAAASRRDRPPPPPLPKSRQTKTKAIQRSQRQTRYPFRTLKGGHFSDYTPDMDIYAPDESDVHDGFCSAAFWACNFASTLAVEMASAQEKRSSERRIGRSQRQNCQRWTGDSPA